MSAPEDSTANDNDNHYHYHHHHLPLDDNNTDFSYLVNGFQGRVSRRDTPDPFSDQHFLDAYPPSPSPPANSSFLDNILNPASLAHNRYSPFNYQPTPPPLRPSYSVPPAMPPNTRANLASTTSRPARLPNGYVDLTATADSPPQQRRKPESPEPGPSAKRQRRAHGTAAAAAARQSPVSLDVEEVDLTDEKQAVQHVLRKQREDAIKAQSKPEEKATTFNNFNCVICMDTPTDLTATACGHLFCHTCLMEALIAGENRNGPGEPKRSQCPVCRKFISRNKASDIIPLSLKKGLKTQPRRKAGASTA